MLIARDFDHRYGMDYELTYSPTLNIDYRELLLAYTVKHQAPCAGYNNNKNNEPIYKIKFKSIICSLIYPAKCTSPDIVFAVNFEARKLENSTQAD